MKVSEFPNGLVIPDDMNEFFDSIIKAYTSADEAGDRTGIHPFLSVGDYVETMLSDDYVNELLNAVSQKTDDKERMLSLLWADMPNWVKSREAFEKHWKMRYNDAFLAMSSGFVRGRVEEALNATRSTHDPEPAMAFGMT